VIPTIKNLSSHIKILQIHYAHATKQHNNITEFLIRLRRKMVRPSPLDTLKGTRLKTSTLVESPKFIGFITVLILINALTLGLETSQDIMLKWGTILYWIDKIILGVFTIELALKIYSYRLGFLRSGWNIFDLIIVVLALLPANGAFAILRAFRILRILRLISVVPQMRRVISAIGHSIPGMTSVIGILSLVFYVSAVLATKLFGTTDNPMLQEWFGTIGASAYTLFQIMTLESWSMGIVRPVMDIYPWAWLFFVPFIIITSFAVLNLFIGIMVDAMQSSSEKTPGSEYVTKKELTEILNKLDEINKHIKK
jgi:voltage-gated sodium channel